MNKTCKKHGVLSVENIIKQEAKQYKKGYKLVCALCKSERSWDSQLKTCKTHGKLSDKNITTRGYCRFCHREGANKKRNNNRALFNAKIAQDRLNNPEKWKEIYKKAYIKSVEKEGKSGRTMKEIARRNGISYEQYLAMFEAQEHKCKICGQEEKRKSKTKGSISRLVLDHCHTTGKVRGLLCDLCNKMLGYARDDMEILVSAYVYLEMHQEPKEQIA